MKTRMLISAGRVMALAVVGVFVAVACYAASFSAEVVSKQGAKVTNGKVFVSDKKVRRESVLSKEQRVTIVRADKNVTWQLRPKDKTYTEAKSAKLIVPDPADLKKFSDVKPLGKEKISGYVCTKTLYIGKEEGGAKITVWMSDKLKWPFKVQITHPGGAMTSEYRKIKEAKQNDSLFEVPYDYRLITPDQPKTVPPTTKDDKKKDGD